MPTKANFNTHAHSPGRQRAEALLADMTFDEREAYIAEIKARLNNPTCGTCRDHGAVHNGISNIQDPLYHAMIPCPKCSGGIKMFTRAGLQEHEAVYNFKDSIMLVEENRTLLTAAKSTLQKFLTDGYGYAYLWSGFGHGKTKVSKVFTAEAVRLGYGVRWVEAFDIFREIKATFADESQVTTESVIQKYIDTPVLVIDELDKIKLSDFVVEHLFGILNRRYFNATESQASTTLIVANNPPSHFGEAFASRLSDSRCSVLAHEAGERGVDVRPSAAKLL